MNKHTRHIIPRYVQIAGYLRAKLESGVWPVGSCMPPIGQLAKDFGVAPLTLREALIVLEEEGLVLRKQGAGTFVQATPRDQRWLTLRTDWESLVRMFDGLEVKRLVVEDSDRTPPLDKGDGKPCSAYKFLKRVHFHRDKPFCALKIYLSSEIFMRAPERFRNNVIIPELTRLSDIKIGKAFQNVRVDVADMEIADLLDIPLAGPVLMVRRIISDENGYVIYFAEVAYRGDSVHLEMDISPS